MSLMPPGGASTSLRLVCPTRTRRGRAISVHAADGARVGSSGSRAVSPAVPCSISFAPGRTSPAIRPVGQSSVPQPGTTHIIHGPSASACRQFGGRNCRGDRPAHCRDFSGIPGLYRSMTCRLPLQRVSEKVAEPLPAGKAPSGLRPWLRLSVASLPAPPVEGGTERREEPRPRPLCLHFAREGLPRAQSGQESSEPGRPRVQG